MMAGGLTITGGLREVSTRLDRAAALARGALACAEAGSEGEAVRITLELDLEELMAESQTLLRTVTLMQRLALGVRERPSDG